MGKAGYQTDDETRLDLLGVRYYDPFIGRFITHDPDRDGLNWYAYAGNNPVNAVDPKGLKPVDVSKDPILQLALGVIKQNLPQFSKVVFRRKSGHQV